MEEPSLFLKAPEAPLPPAPRRFKFSLKTIGSVFGFLILTIGLGFGLLQVQRNQEIQKSSAAQVTVSTTTNVDQGIIDNCNNAAIAAGSSAGGKVRVAHYKCPGPISDYSGGCQLNGIILSFDSGLQNYSFDQAYCGTQQIDVSCQRRDSTGLFVGGLLRWNSTEYFPGSCQPQVTPKYLCSNNSCVRDDTNGTMTDSNCNNSCSQQTTPKYKCSNNSCVRDDANGGYTDSNCNNSCSTPAPTCNNTGVSLSISPNQARSGEMVTFQVSGDASTYLEDLFPIGGVINYPSDAVARAVSFIGTVSGTPGQTYRWTRRWKHCVDNFQNCSQVCEASANFSVLANATPVPTNTPTPTPSPTPSPTPTPTTPAQVCLATYSQTGNGILFSSTNPAVGFLFYPVGSQWQLGQANGIDSGTNTTPGLGTNHNPGRLDISFIHQGATKSICITLPPVPTPTPTTASSPTPTPTPTPMAICQQVKIYRGTPLVEIAASEIQQGNSITFRAFANATNITLSIIRFSVRIGSAAPTTYDRTASLVGGVYQADLQLDITQAATYIVSAVPILP